MRWTLIQTAFLGDVVLTLPLLAEMADRFPGSEIQVVVRPEAASVVETADGVKDVVVYDKRRTDSGIFGWGRILQKIRAFHPDTVLVPHRSARSILLANFSNAIERIGYDRAAKVPGLTQRIPYRRDAHETARLLDLLHPFTGEVGRPRQPIMRFTEEDERIVSSQFPELNETNWIGIAPGAVWFTKKYPYENYLEVAQQLSDRGYRIIAIGGSADASECERLAEVGKGISVAGKLLPRHSAAVIRKCQLMIANDSAPLHLAQSMAVPTLAIFGATVPEFGFGPLGEHDRVLGIAIECRPCAIHGGNRCPKGHFRCMKEIAPHTVVDTVIAMLSGK